MAEETGSTETHELPSLKYLTVQDMLWINLQTTKKVQHFNFARLEEATFYQYGYGASRDLARQSGRLLSGFIKLHPFEAGNEATAFLGAATFLLMNGQALTLNDEEASKWMDKVKGGSIRAEEALGDMLVPDDSAVSRLHSDVREAVRAVMMRYPKTVQSLSEPHHERVAS